MTRQTSIIAYNQIKESGLLNGLQWQVYEALYQRGPSTQKEICVERFPNQDARIITSRFSELQKMDAITYVSKRNCTYTGKYCMVWDVSGRIPIKIEPRRKKDEIIKELQERNSWLEIQIRDLKQKISSLEKRELF